MQLMQRASNLAGIALSILMSVGCAQGRLQTLPPPAQIDEQPSAIELEVMDSSGAVIRNARVLLKDDSAEVRAGGATNQAGVLRLISPGDGLYSLEVSAPGFETHTEKFAVKSSSITRAAVKLEVRALQGAVYYVDQPNLAMADPPAPTEIALLPISPVPAPTRPAKPFKRFFNKLLHR